MTPHPSSNARAGFSLVEVVVAIGIFALAIVAVVGLLTPITRDASSVIETTTAVRLAENVNRELERVGGATVASLGGTSLFLVATPDGSRVLRSGQDAAGTLGTSRDAENDLDDTPVAGIAERDRFYIIEVRLLKNDGTGKNIYYNASDGAVPVEVRVAWPFYSPATPVPTGTPSGNWNGSSVAGTLVPVASRSYYIFSAAIRR